MTNLDTFTLQTTRILHFSLTPWLQPHLTLIFPYVRAKYKD